MALYGLPDYQTSLRQLDFWFDFQNGGHLGFLMMFESIALLV